MVLYFPHSKVTIRLTFSIVLGFSVATEKSGFMNKTGRQCHLKFSTYT